MKQRILEWLKSAALGDERIIEKIKSHLLDSIRTAPKNRNSVQIHDKKEISRIALKSLEHIILEDYRALKVLTIDSFVNSIAASSALEMGLPPNYEIIQDVPKHIGLVVDEILSSENDDNSVADVFALLKKFLQAYLYLEQNTQWNPRRAIYENIKFLYDEENHRGKNFKPSGIKGTEIVSERKILLDEFLKAAYLCPDARSRGPMIKKLLSGALEELSDAQMGHIPGSLRPRLAGYYEKLSAARFDSYIELYEYFRRVMEKYKKDRRIVFISDLNSRVASRLSSMEVPSVYFMLGENIENFLIDEFQDTNKLQARIGYLLAREHGNIMVVGDDSQSIYGFRGANFKNIIDFPKQFKDTRIITLEQNYRSIQPILDLTNGIIANAQEKFTKNLFTKRKGGTKPVLVEAPDESGQSEFVAEKILELREEGISLNKIAVLFRAGWHSNDLEVELVRRGIPFVKYGGFKFMESAHIKDALSFLRVLENPKDSISWMRILQMLKGIGPKKADMIINLLVENGNFFHLPESALSVKEKSDESLAGLFAMLKEIKEKDLPPSEALRTVYDFYSPILERKYDDYHKRTGDLDSFMAIAEKYSNLEKLLSDLALDPLEMSQNGVKEAGTDDESLVLSTIHSSKGLEWDTVFIIFANDGYIPLMRSLSNEDDIEEERRLLYVAATRAENRLFVIKPDSVYSGNGYFDSSFRGFSKISCFLEEGRVADEFMEKIRIGNGGEDFEDDEVIYVDFEE